MKRITSIRKKGEEKGEGRKIFMNRVFEEWE